LFAVDGIRLSFKPKHKPVKADDRPNFERGQALVRDFMAKDVVTIPADMPLHDASCILSQHGITGAPVVKAAVEPSGRAEVIGMLSQTDLLYRAAGTARVPLKTKGASATIRYSANTQLMRKALADNVRSAMSCNVVKISPSATVQQAAADLLRHKVSRFPVVDHRGALVGIISTTDIMELVTKDPEGCFLLIP
jgi:CBS domain-containing protein